MKTTFRNVILGLTISAALISAPLYAMTNDKPAEYTSTKTNLENITPQEALKRLIEGNKRFVSQTTIKRNLLEQKKYTGKSGQSPSAIILSCMDSRGTPEITFDQGIGDIFAVRLAGNVIDADQLGGMEFATKVVGTKLIVIMGHTKCGAVGGACKNVQLGNLTQLLEKIKPAVAEIKTKQSGKLSCDDQSTIDKIAKQNVLNGIKQVKEDSPLIQQQIDNKEVMIVGAMHDIETGKVVFFDENGKDIS